METTTMDILNRDKVIIKIKEMVKVGIERSFNPLERYKKTYMEADEYFIISKIIYDNIDKREIPKFLALRDLLVVDYNIGFYDDKVETRLNNAYERIDLYLEKDNPRWMF